MKINQNKNVNLVNQAFLNQNKKTENKNKFRKL